MIFLLGYAGSGKTTQAKLLAKELGCLFLSVGQLLRDKLPAEEKQKQLKGLLIADSVVLPIVEAELEHLDAANKEIVVDGWLRKKPEAEWVVKQSQAGKIKVTGIFKLDIHKDIAEARLLKRGRADDTKEGIDKRFAEFEEQSGPIIDYLTEKGLRIIEINADQPEEQVSKDIIEAISAT